MKRLVTLFFFLFPFCAIAQPFAGLQIGQSSARHVCDDIEEDTGLSFLSMRCDDTSTTWSATAGYRFNPNLSLEAFYTDLGKASLDGVVTDGVDAIAVRETARVTGFGASITGYWPLTERFELIGQAGMLRWNLDDKAAASDGFISASESSRKTGTDPLLGVGASLHVTDQLSVRALYQRFLNIDDTDVDAVSVGVYFQQ